jgi:hypothetical protein
VGWPLVDGRTHAPVVAMADPWLIGVFAISAIPLALGHAPQP